MKKIQIIHNPTAGNGKHNKESLLRLFSDYSEELQYIATSEECWSDFPKKAVDVIYVAGGDGTVRNVAEVLFRNNLPSEKCPPLGLIALGTANNIAETLGIPSNKEGIEINPEGPRQTYDCGRIEGIGEKDFFMESFGAGIFPELIRRAKEEEVSNVDPEKELRHVLQLMYDIVKAYKPQKAKIKADGISIKGSFLLIEVMNIKAVGPNLELAPGADPGDGFFDLILIPEGKRVELLEYLEKRINGVETPHGLKDFANSLRVQKVNLKWKDSLLHVDDTLIDDYEGKKIKVQILPKAFEFIEGTN